MKREQLVCIWKEGNAVLLKTNYEHSRERDLLNSSLSHETVPR